MSNKNKPIIPIVDPRPIEAQQLERRDPDNPDNLLIKWLESVRVDVHDSHYGAAVTDLERRIAIGEHREWLKSRRG